MDSSHVLCVWSADFDPACTWPPPGHIESARISLDRKNYDLILRHGACLMQTGVDFYKITERSCPCMKDFMYTFYERESKSLLMIHSVKIVSAYSALLLCSSDLS